MNISFSKILETHGKRLIGRYDPGSEGDPFPLKTGFTDAHFHWTGYLPSCTDLLNIFDRGSAIYTAVILISLVGSLSGPQALDASRLLIVRSTSRG